MAHITEDDILGCLLGMNPYRFEELIGSLLDKMGYSINVTQGSQDGGVDIEATLKTPTGGKINYVVQVKRYKEPVGPRELRALIGTKASKRASGTIFVTTSDFTKSAKEFAQKTEMELIDGRQLVELVIDLNLIKEVEKLAGISLGTTPEAKMAGDRLEHRFDEDEKIRKIIELAERDKISLALDECEELLRQNNKNAETWFIKACLLLTLHQKDDFFTYHYQDYWETGRHSKSPLIGIRETSIVYKEVIDAKKCLETALKLDSEMIVFWLMAIDFYTRLSENPERVKLHLIDSALEKMPNDPSLWFLKGEISLKNGDEDFAIKCYQNVMKIDPKEEDTKETLEELLEIRSRRKRARCEKCGATNVNLNEKPTYKNYKDTIEFLCDKCYNEDKEYSSSSTDGEFYKVTTTSNETTKIWSSIALIFAGIICIIAFVYETDESLQICSAVAAPAFIILGFGLLIHYLNKK